MKSDKNSTNSYISFDIFRNGYPKQLAAETILRSIKKYFNENKGPHSLTQVMFVLYDTESVNVYLSELGKLDVSK